MDGTKMKMQTKRNGLDGKRNERIPLLVDCIGYVCDQRLSTLNIYGNFPFNFQLSTLLFAPGFFIRF